MDILGPLFETYGLLLVFGAVLLEQMGPPIPSGPLLIVAGALADEGRLSAFSIAAVAWVACMLGKLALYMVGKHYGRQAMGALCQLAVTPNSSIGKTDRHFERWDAALLILAEFIPGARTLAPSLAGAEKLSPTPFLLYGGGDEGPSRVGGALGCKRLACCAGRAA
jgi:membrane protein DedA with SNARE-associated domain